MSIWASFLNVVAALVFVYSIFGDVGVDEEGLNLLRTSVVLFWIAVSATVETVTGRLPTSMRVDTAPWKRIASSICFLAFLVQAAVLVMPKGQSSASVGMAVSLAALIAFLTLTFGSAFQTYRLRESQ
jgi:hypothetical protein